MPVPSLQEYAGYAVGRYNIDLTPYVGYGSLNLIALNVEQGYRAFIKRQPMCLMGECHNEIVFSQRCRKTSDISDFFCCAAFSGHLDLVKLLPKIVFGKIKLFRIPSNCVKKEFKNKLQKRAFLKEIINKLLYIGACQNDKELCLLCIDMGANSFRQSKLVAINKLYYDIYDIVKYEYTIWTPNPDELPPKIGNVLILGPKLSGKTTLINKIILECARKYGYRDVKYNVDNNELSNSIVVLDDVKYKIGIGLNLEPNAKECWYTSRHRNNLTILATSESYRNSFMFIHSSDIIYYLCVGNDRRELKSLENHLSIHIDYKDTQGYVPYVIKFR